MVEIKINKIDEKSEFSELKGLMFDKNSVYRFGCFLADMFGENEFGIIEEQPDGQGCATYFNLNPVDKNEEV